MTNRTKAVINDRSIGRIISDRKWIGRSKRWWANLPPSVCVCELAPRHRKSKFTHKLRRVVRGAVSNCGGRATKQKDASENNRLTKHRFVNKDGTKVAFVPVRFRIARLIETNSMLQRKREEEKQKTTKTDYTKLINKIHVAIEMHEMKTSERRKKMEQKEVNMAERCISYSWITKPDSTLSVQAGRRGEGGEERHGQRPMYHLINCRRQAWKAGTGITLETPNVWQTKCVNK